MKETLEFILADLGSQVSSLCRHFRNKDYGQNSQSLLNAQTSLVYYEVLRDELSIILEQTSRLRSILTGPQAVGAIFISDLSEKDGQECLGLFSNDNCPLGRSTGSLREWVSSFADRQLQARRGFEAAFPNLDFLLLDRSSSEHQPRRVVSNAYAFDQSTMSFLLDIRRSNALEEFNSRMLEISTLVESAGRIDEVLRILKDIDMPIS